MNMTGQLTSANNSSRWVSYGALLLSFLTFIGGNNIAARIYEVFPNQNDNKTIIEGIIAVLNIVLALYVLVDLSFIRPIVLDDNDKSPSLKSFKQFLWAWECLWITWIVFYGCLAAQWLHLIQEEISKDILWHVSEGINIFNGFFFYYFFFVLDQPSVKIEGNPDRAHDFRRNWILTLMLGLVIFIVSVATSQMDNSEQFILLGKLAPAYMAVGMVFFFGRLDSHYLTLPRVILAPLYLYAIIQLYWGHETFQNYTKFDAERVTIFGLALVLKFVMFLILSKLIRSENFRKYLILAGKELDKK